MQILQCKLHRLGKSRRGFSLIEMLIVLAILALLAGLVIQNFDKLFGGASEDVAKQFVTTSLEAPLLQFKIHTGSYPSTSEGLAALLTAPSARAAKWKGPYVKELPADPWGNPYQYRYPGTQNADSYDVYSMGPNGTEGGGDDIGNWD